METLTLVKLAKAYADHSNLKLSTVSTYATNDGKFFNSLERDGGCTIKRANRVVKWFSTNWPADLEWPTDIPRPQKSKEEAA